MNRTQAQPEKQRLYQVNVETREQGVIAVGPKMLKGACEQFAATIDEQIRLGREKTYSNPQVVPILNLEN